MTHNIVLLICNTQDQRHCVLWEGSAQFNTALFVIVTSISCMLYKCFSSLHCSQVLILYILVPALQRGLCAICKTWELRLVLSVYTTTSHDYDLGKIMHHQMLSKKKRIVSCVVFLIWCLRLILGTLLWGLKVIFSQIHISTGENPSVGTLAVTLVRAHLKWKDDFHQLWYTAISPTERMCNALLDWDTVCKL